MYTNLDSLLLLPMLYTITQKVSMMPIFIIHNIISTISESCIHLIPALLCLVEIKFVSYLFQSESSIIFYSDMQLVS